MSAQTPRNFSLGQGPSQPNRRSFLLATVSSAVIPVLAGAGDASSETSVTKPSSLADVTLSINGGRHRLAVDTRTTLLDLLHEHTFNSLERKKAAIMANVVPARFTSMGGASSRA